MKGSGNIFCLPFLVEPQPLLEFRPPHFQGFEITHFLVEPQPLLESRPPHFQGFEITHFLVEPQPLLESRPPHFQGFEITHTHTTVGTTPLDEGSARRRDLYLTAHNTHNREASMSPARFNPANPANDRPQTHALDRAEEWKYGSSYS